MSGLGDKGKWAEKQVQEWLEQTSAQHWDFAYHRFPDARAARGALSAQPSDFLVAHGGASLLEVKETANPRRLPKSKIGQYGKLKMFYEAGVPIYIVIYMSELMAWTYLDGEDLFIYEDCPPSYSLAGRPTYPTAASVLNRIYDL